MTEQNLASNQPANQDNPEPTVSPTDNPLANQDNSQGVEQFQRVVKQEKHLQEERRKIDEARKAFEADKQAADTYKNLKGKDPFEILEHFGLSYDKLTQLALDKAKPVDPIAKKALETVEKLQNEIQQEKDKAHKERLSRAEIQLMSDIDNTIKTNEYDVIEKLDAKGAVRDYMEEVYAQTGKIPDITEACQAVTDHIVGLYDRISDSKHVVSRKKAEVIVPNTEEKPIETLSQKMVQTTKIHPKPETESERMMAAIKAMEMVKGGKITRL